MHDVNIKTTMNMWGMAAAPLVDGERLIVLAGGKNGACVLALHKDTGAEIWQAWMRPIRATAAGDHRLLAAFGRIRAVGIAVASYSTNPDIGRIVLDTTVRVATWATAMATPTSNCRSGRGLHVRLVVLQRAAACWRLGRASCRTANSCGEVTATANCQHSDRRVARADVYPGSCGTATCYGVCSYGQLRCLDAESGRRIWDTLAATGEERWSNAFLVRHQDRFFICNERGELIVAKLSPDGYQELGRAQLIEPTNVAGRRKIVWSHPAFANRCVYARNDREIVCVDLAANR